MVARRPQAVIPLDPYLFWIRDRKRFYEMLAVVRVHPYGEGSNEGLALPLCDEHTLHEYAHAVTLGLRLTPVWRKGSMSELISDKLNHTPRVGQYVNEVKALAAELFVLWALDAVTDYRLWLHQLADDQHFHKLPQALDHYLSRAKGARRAARDARRIVCRIRRHAREERQLALEFDRKEVTYARTNISRAELSGSP
jgi:hypothetical protein